MLRKFRSSPNGSNRRTVIAGVAAALLLGAPALAQRFVFVSTRAPEADFVVYDRPWQSEVFAYRDGSEIRLTRSLHASEYDPAPSPSGALIAYVALDHAQEGDRAGWGWYLGVIDALTGRQVASWPLPNTAGMTRPSGGFQPTWLDDGALLLQVPSAVGEWEVHGFALSGATRPLTTGFGIVLDADRELLATERRDGAYLVEVATGSERRVGEGTPLGWWGDALFLGGGEGLSLLDTASGARTTVTAQSGFYTELRVSPSGRSYAYLRILGGEGGAELVIADADHEVVYSARSEGWFSSLDWLDDERLVVAREKLDGDIEVMTLDLLGRGFVIGSSGVDHSPRAFPAR